MKNIRFLIASVMLFITPAVAQSSDRSSTSADRMERSPGTTGAMNSASSGIATSAIDVKSQQDGNRLAADGGGTIGEPRKVERQSPGTVGSAPGSTAPNGR